MNTLSSIIAYTTGGGLPSPVQATIGLVIIVLVLSFILYLMPALPDVAKKVLIGIMVVCAIVWVFIVGLALYQAAG